MLENTRNGVPGYAHVGLTRQLRPQFGRLPDGQVHGFGQVLGEVERLTLHRGAVKERSGNGRICGRKRCGSVAARGTAGAVATAVVVVAGAVGAGVGVFRAVGAGRLRFVLGAAGFFGGLLVKLLRMVGISAPTSPSAVRRKGEQNEEEGQCGEAVLHNFQVRR